MLTAGLAVLGCTGWISYHRQEIKPQKDPVTFLSAHGCGRCTRRAGPPSAVLAFQAPTGQVQVIPPTALSPPSRQCSGALGLPTEPLLLPSWRVQQSGSWESSSLILRLPGGVSRCLPTGSPDSVPGRGCVCHPGLWTPSQCPSGLASPTFLLASGLGLW